MTSTRWRRDAVVLMGFGVLVALAYRPIFGGRVIAGVDAFQLAIPDARFLLECIRNGEWPLWTPYERLGQPFAGQLQSQAFYLPRVLSALIAGPYWGITLEQLFHAFVSCIGTFAACRSLGRSRGASFVASAAFALGPLSTELANVPNVAGAAAWSGAILTAARALDWAPSLRSAALLALFCAASLMTGSPETLIWQIAVVIVAGAPARQWRGLWRHGLALGVSFLLAAVVVLPTLEFLSHSIRLESVPGQFAWSAPPASVIALFWINADLPRPPGEQHLVACLFQGTVMVGLAVTTLRRRGASRRLFWLGVVLAVLSLGDHFMPSKLVLSLPPFSLFRYPVKYLVGASFCLCVAAARGLDRLSAMDARQVNARTLYGATLFAVLTALGARWLPIRGDPHIGIEWACVFVVAGLLAFQLPRGPGRRHLVGFGLGSLALVELALVSYLWGTPMWLPASVLAQPSSRTAELPSPTEGRVSVQIPNDARMALWHDPEQMVAESRDNVIPLRNVEDHVAIVEGYGPPEPREYWKVREQAPQALNQIGSVTKYIRPTSAPADEPVGSQGIVSTAAPAALPRAYLTQRTRIASETEVLKELSGDSEAFRETALLEAGTALRSETPCESKPPVWKEYRATSLTIEAAPCATSYLVVGDSAYPGWEAEVDGQPAPIERANLLVRAVLLSPGQHLIQMRYRPMSFRVGAILSLLALALVGVALALPRSVFHRDRHRLADQV